MYIPSCFFYENHDTLKENYGKNERIINMQLFFSYYPFDMFFNFGNFCDFML
jgi:hypothetical protein